METFLCVGLICCYSLPYLLVYKCDFIKVKYVVILFLPFFNILRLIYFRLKFVSNYINLNYSFVTLCCSIMLLSFL
jgi:hypothetical protein